MPGPIATIATSASRDVTGDHQRGEDVHRLVVAAERVPARDRGVDEAAVAQRRDEIAQRERERGTVGHHVRDPGVGARRADPDRHRGELAVQRRRDHGESGGVGAAAERRVEVLLGGLRRRPGGSCTGAS